MYLSAMTTGSELKYFMEENFSEYNSDIKWKISRLDQRNNELKIKNIVITGKLDNAVVGYSINNDVNIIILFQSEVDDEVFKELIEIIYKNDIYILELGKDWIFNTTIGNQFISKVFNGVEYSFWKEVIYENHCLISYNKFSSLNSAFDRFQNSIKWIHPKIEDKLAALKLNSILVVEKLHNFNVIKALDPTMIVTFNLGSEMIDYCWRNKIILVWIHDTSFFNEIAREFVYYFNKTKKIKTKLHLNREIKFF